MALAFITQNGKGLGHLVRTRLLCAHLRAHGARPLVFAQGHALERYILDDYVRCIPYFWKLTTREQEWIAREIVDTVRLSDPAVVLEDTHPIDVSFPDDIHRGLVLRPLNFAHALDMLSNPRLGLHKVFVADHPDSPTWPYSAEEWRSLGRVADLTPVGPIFTRPSADMLRDAAAWMGATPFCLISAGGGGQMTGSQDIAPFLNRAAEIAADILRTQPAMRMLLVKGPFFPAAVDVPDVFETIGETDLMPALFTLASGAIIRPGFNSIWECVAGSTPFAPVVGDTFEEPVEQRLRSLSGHGLIASDPARDWWNPLWRTSFSRTCDVIAKRWPGYPTNRALADFACGSPPTTRKAGRDSQRVLFVSINGIGMGHVARTTKLASRVRESGADVHVAIETVTAQPPAADSLPRTILPHWPYEPRIFESYLPQMRTLLDAFDPHVVVFDRHQRLPEGLAAIPELAFRQKVAIASLPSPGLLASFISDRDMDRTFLLHSETEFEALYGKALARLINASDRVEFAGGPIDGTAPGLPGTPVPIPRTPFALWVLGGGGEHEGVHETETMAGLISDLATYLDREYELPSIVIHGPYFQHRGMLDRCALVQEAASNLRELIRKARLTLFRPGFNLSREVYAHAGAYIGLDTYQSEEASRQHLRWLSARKASAVSALELGSLIAACNRVLAREPAAPASVPWRNGAPRIARHLMRNDPGVWTRAEPAFAAIRGRGIVLVRIDDVVSNDPQLSWLLEQLASRGIPASLEAIPMRVELPAAWIERMDPHEALFEISQHGCWHVNIQDPGEHYGEFPHPITSRLDRFIAQLNEGKQRLEGRFGARFRGGFSPPFDSLPDWLPTVWESLGGRYISMCALEPRECALPSVIVRPDVWAWDTNRPKTPARLLGELHENLVQRGTAGLVLHPRTITPDFAPVLCTLLDFLRDVGIPFGLMSEAAAERTRGVATAASLS